MSQLEVLSFKEFAGCSGKGWHYDLAEGTTGISISSVSIGDIPFGQAERNARAEELVLYNGILFTGAGNCKLQAIAICG